MSKPVGVLALQGNFAEHIALLNSNSVSAIEVKNKETLSACSSLIIPGGESTTISKLMSLTGIDAELKKLVKKGFPVFGICAGAIVISKSILDEERFKPLGLIDIAVKRNAFGRQADSFETTLAVGEETFAAVFIRAPEIIRVGKKVEVLASLNNSPVLVKGGNKGNVMACTFHPEIEKSMLVHKLFLKLTLR